MAKNETKKVTPKEVAPKAETKKVATKEVKEVAPKNEAKVDAFISIEDVTKLYAEAGVRCTNPTAKGNYRIMGSKSSLNVKPKKGYYIYSCDSDFDLVTEAKLSAKDLIVEKGTNSQDPTRPNTIICTTVETLKALLKVYATNPLNKLVVETKEVAVK